MPEEITIYPPMTAAEFNVGAYDPSWEVPLQQSEYGDTYAYGHIDKAKFAATVDKLNDDLDGYDEPCKVEHVQHRRAVTVSPPEEWWIHWGDQYQDHPHSFPITILDV